MVQISKLTKNEIKQTGFNNRSIADKFMKTVLNKKARDFKKKEDLINTLKKEYNKMKNFGIDLNENAQAERKLNKIDKTIKTGYKQKADFEKLSGVKEIGEATLLSINTQLLTELAAINKSKMAEADKELAREEAFKKYNAAITAAGDLAAKNSYSERVQIQLTEIEKLASLSKTANAQLTLIKLSEAEELASIKATLAAELKAIAESKASESDKAIAREAALKKYGEALKSINNDEINSLGSIDAAYKRSYDLKFQQEQYLTALRLAGIRSVQDAENDSLSAKLRGFSTTALGLAALASAEREIAISRLASDIGTASMIQGIQAGLTPAEAAVGARYAAQSAYNYYITITAGIGDPEAIARQVEDILNQSGYRGTSTNRGSGLYAE
jgi:pterin-4a-carbinolamine dehydratase